jgi:hypothetical protein
MHDPEKHHEKNPSSDSMKDMSDSDVSRLMASKYGDEWEVKDLDMRDPIVIEFFDRTSRGQ